SQGDGQARWRGGTGGAADRRFQRRRRGDGVGSRSAILDHHRIHQRADSDDENGRRPSRDRGDRSLGGGGGAPRDLLQPVAPIERGRGERSGGGLGLSGTARQLGAELAGEALLDRQSRAELL